MIHKRLGDYGERLASAFLTSQCFTILGKNLRSRFGEIDLLAYKDRSVYVVEVKARNGLLDPLETISSRKLRRMRHTSQIHLQRFRLPYDAIHLSAIGISFFNDGLFAELTFLPSLEW